MLTTANDPCISIVQ